MSAELFEELEVITSIYAEAVSVTTRPDLCGDCEDATVTTTVSYENEEHHVKLTFTIPFDYPTGSSPTIALSFQASKQSCNARHRKEAVTSQLQQCIEENKGNVCIFAVIEALKDSLLVFNEGGDGSADALFDIESARGEEDGDDGRVTCSAGDDATDDDNETMKAISVFSFTPDPTSSLTPSRTSNSGIVVTQGPATVERKSTFISHLSAVRSMEEVQEFRALVTTDKRFARATHNIFAYRFTCPSTGVVHHDCDDDGETAAGTRLAEMIRLMGAMNVAVIVSRFFGGTLLGPDRFKFICNSARHLLEQNGYGSSGSSNQAAKKNSHQPHSQQNQQHRHSR